MRGLVIKDLINIKKDSKSYLFALGVYIVILGNNGNLNLMTGIICILCTMLSNVSFASDEKVGWNTYAISSGINRKDIVKSKYILGLICSFIGFVASSIISVINNGLHINSLTLPVVMWSVAIISLSLIIPISLIMGVEKGRILITLLVVSPIVFSFDATKIILSQQLIKFVPMLCGLDAIFVFIISNIICLRIYKNKEL